MSAACRSRLLPRAAPARVCALALKGQGTDARSPAHRAHHLDAVEAHVVKEEQVQKISVVR
jgi:hypothetical protein